MKFFAGFMTGMVVTLIGVLFWLKGETAPATTAPVASATSSFQPADSPQAMPAGFADFFEQFHRDSIYQMAHITFPLEGIPANADSATVAGDSFRWPAATWVLHRPFNDMDGQFSRQFIPMSDDFVIEQIKGVNDQYGMQRRFSRREDGWYLIYYAGMNQLAVEDAEEPQAVE